MFTGIIESLGKVRQLEGGVLLIDAEPQDWKLGESVAVNGCCLTLVDWSDGLRFDLSEETLKRTALETLEAGSPVNLERAMRADGRFGGHVVQGHVDGVGQLKEIKGEAFVWTIPSDLSRYLIDKGSIAIDGISLTVVEPRWNEFETWIIPHTLENTSLGSLLPGMQVNVEVDLIAKYVERLLGNRKS